MPKGMGYGNGKGKSMKMGATTSGMKKKEMMKSKDMSKGKRTRRAPGK